MAISTILKNLLCAIPILCLFWNTAQAQDVQCFPYDRLMDRLGSIGEIMTAVGVDGNGNLVQVMTSESGGWTFLVRIERDSAVYACPLSAGEGWEHHEPKRGQKS